ncbi:hypothetical protein L1887_16622 [Cichorium endivia]|nr:hypothetical protein L1887_16622 [Cichorium endivia]
MVKGREGERIRLYTRGTVLGYKRSKSNQYPNTSLVQIEGVNTKEEVACPIFLLNPWELGLGCLCTQATSKQFVGWKEERRYHCWCLKCSYNNFVIVTLFCWSI